MRSPSDSTASDREKVLGRFLTRVELLREDQGGCWVWRGCLNDDGYGYVRLGNKAKQFVHRLAFELFVGPIPEEKEVCHSRDVRHCVRPSHLFVGTHQENIADAVQKGRMRGGNYGRTHCHRGHEMTEENTIHRSNGTRLCRICRREWFKKWQQSRKAA